MKQTDQWNTFVGILFDSASVIATAAKEKDEGTLLRTLLMLKYLVDKAITRLEEDV